LNGLDATVENAVRPTMRCCVLHILLEKDVIFPFAREYILWRILIQWQFGHYVTVYGSLQERVA